MNVVSDVVMSTRRVPVSASDEVETIVQQVLDRWTKEDIITEYMYSCRNVSGGCCFAYVNIQ